MARGDGPRCKIGYFDLTGSRQRRLDIGKHLLAPTPVVNVNEEDPVEAAQRITGGKGVQYVLERSGAPNALNKLRRSLMIYD
jgi:threonine dehydrogenase-like Zn-dependent dehydrogenase